MLFLGLLLGIHLIFFITELLVEVVHIATVCQCVLLTQTTTVLLHHSLNGRQYTFVLDCCREFVRLALDDFSQNVTEDLTASCFWQFVDHQNILEAGNRTDLFSHESNQLLFDSFALASCLNHHESDRNLSLQLLNLRHNSSFRDDWVRDENFFHGCCGKSVACSVNDVIKSGHNVKVSVLIEVSSITGGVVTRRLIHVFLEEALIVVVECAHE